MPATPTPSAPELPQVSHEYFCKPRPENKEPRIESFLAAQVGANGVETGRMVRVTRCLECGAARYTNEEGA